MSLPPAMKAKLVPDIVDEKLGYVALLEEAPSVAGFGLTPEDALQELRFAVLEIQRRTGGGDVEILDPPLIDHSWIQEEAGV